MRLQAFAGATRWMASKSAAAGAPQFGCIAFFLKVMLDKYPMVVNNRETSQMLQT
jgi:hypothetical protein